MTQLGDYPVSVAEYAKFKEFKKTSAYVDFDRTREAIKSIGQNPSMRIIMKKIQAACS